MATPRTILRLFFVAALATNLPVSASTVEQRDNGSPNNRWLTYACRTKSEGSGRNLSGRMLTHPCNSQNSRPKQSSTNDLYNKNSSRGSNTFINVTLGVIFGVMVLLGFIYYIDQETFKEITGKDGPFYGRCSKPRIDDDDDDDGISPFEQDVYHLNLTKETKQHLAEKHDREIDRPRRMLKQMCLFFFKRKEYDEEDKYNTPWNGDENDPGKENMLLVFLEDIRLRLCWKPTKKYSGNRKMGQHADKYAVQLEDSESNNSEEGSVKYAASSYESAEPGEAPW